MRWRLLNCKDAGGLTHKRLWYYEKLCPTLYLRSYVTLALQYSFKVTILMAFYINPTKYLFGTYYGFCILNDNSK